jgi:Flp pilus assembly protein TadG
VVPIMLLLFAGAVDFGRWFYVSLQVTNAAHAGAEYGSLNPSDTAGISAAARASAPNVNLSTPTVSWGCECSDGTSYSANCSPAPVCSAGSSRGSNVVHRVQVTTSAVYKTWMPWLVIPASFTIPETATMRGN